MHKQNNGMNDTATLIWLLSLRPLGILYTLH
jgi:hypothetical protein